MVRGFFNGFFTGQLEKLNPDVQYYSPIQYKQVIVNNIDDLFTKFVSFIFPMLIRLNNADLDVVLEDMKRRHISKDTPHALLLRYACGSKELFLHVKKEYQKQVTALLDGHLESVSQYFSDCPSLHDTSDNGVVLTLAIRSIVRVHMHAYAFGMGNIDVTTGQYRQTTVYKLLLGGMMTLLHEREIKLEGDNLEMLFRKVSLNSDNFELLMNEMNQTYTELI